MFYEWEDEGKTFKKEVIPGNTPAGHGYNRLILTGKDIEKFLRMPDDRLRTSLENLYTRDMNF